MARPTLVVLAVLTVALLAGCSKAPPSGTLGAGSSGVTLDGTSDNHYVKFDSGGNPTGPVPVVGPSTQCAQGMSPTPPPAGVKPCTPPSTRIHVHLMALPQPEAAGYKAFLTGGTGANLTLAIGDVTPDANNMWDLNKTFNQDLEGQYKTIELRMGDFTLATASAGEGSAKLAIAPSLDALTAKGTYKGKALDVVVSGLPENGTYMGRLYTQDAKTCLLTMAESFPVKNGANNFTAKVNVGDYAEFHIHVGTSLINLYHAKVNDSAPACKPAA